VKNARNYLVLFGTPNTYRESFMSTSVHELKIEPQFFEQVLSGAKTFEIRKDDRGYQKGDTVNLSEYDPRASFEPQFTGRGIIANIGFVTSYEQKPGYVVFSLIDPKPDF